MPKVKLHNKKSSECKLLSRSSNSYERKLYTTDEAKKRFEMYVHECEHPLVQKVNLKVTSRGLEIKIDGNFDPVKLKEFRMKKDKGTLIMKHYEKMFDLDSTKIEFYHQMEMLNRFLNCCKK